MNISEESLVDLIDYRIKLIRREFGIDIDLFIDDAERCIISRNGEEVSNMSIPLAMAFIDGIYYGCLAISQQMESMKP